MATTTTTVLGGAVTGATSTTPSDGKKTTTEQVAAQQAATAETVQPTTTVQVGVTKYAAAQKFEVTPTGEVKVVPLQAGGKEGGVLYSQLPASAKAALEQRGVISGGEAAPSGKIYQYAGAGRLPSGELGSRYLVTELPSAGKAAMPSVQTAAQQISKTETLIAKEPLKIQTGKVGETVQAASILTTPQSYFPASAFGAAATPSAYAVELTKKEGVSTKPIVDVKAFRQTETTSKGEKVDVVRFVGVDEEGKIVKIPEAKPREGMTEAEKQLRASIPKLPSRFEVAVPIPDKEKAVSQAIEKGYEQHLVDVSKMADAVPLTKEEYTSVARADLEKQFESNVQSFIQSPEIKKEIVTSLSLRKEAIQKNVEVMATPQYQIPKAAEYFARKGGEAEKLFEKAPELQQAILKSPLASWEQFGTIGSAEKSREVAIKGIARQLAAEQYYGTKVTPELEQYGETLASAFTGGLYQPRPESIRAGVAASAPMTVIPSTVGLGFVAGAAFTAAPTLATGAARAAGVGVSAATKVGSGVKVGQAAIGLGAAGYTGLKGYELEAQTIPKLEAEGATPEQIAGLRAEFYGKLAAGAAGAAFGAKLTQQYLQKEVVAGMLKPKGVSRLIEEPSGKLRGKASYEYTEPTTRAMQLSRMQPKKYPVEFDIKESRLIMETPEGVSTGISKTVTTKPLAEQKALVTRRIDIEKTKVTSLMESEQQGIPVFRYTALRGTTRPSIGREAGEIAQLGTKETPSAFIKEFSIRSAGKTFEPKTTTESGIVARYIKIESKPEPPSAIETLHLPTKPFTTEGNQIIGFPSFLLKPKTTFQITPAERIGAIKAVTAVEERASEAASRLSSISRTSYDKIYGLTGEETFQAGAIGSTLAKATLKPSTKTELVSRIRLQPSVPLELEATRMAGKLVERVPPPTAPPQLAQLTLQEELAIPVEITTPVAIATLRTTTRPPRIFPPSLRIPPATAPPPPAPPLSGRKEEGEAPSGRRRKRKAELGRLPVITEKVSKTYGILSEGISKQLFGKATFKETGIQRIGASPTLELEKAGIKSPAEFFELGGFVTQGKRAKEIKGSFKAITGKEKSFSKIKL